MGVMSVETGSPTAQPSAPHGPAARRRAVFYVGLALIVAGVVLLGYVAWQLFGTNVVAHREQQRIVTDLQTSWSFPDKPARKHPGPRARTSASSGTRPGASPGA